MGNPSGVEVDRVMNMALAAASYATTHMLPLTELVAMPQSLGRPLRGLPCNYLPRWGSG